MSERGGLDDLRALEEVEDDTDPDRMAMAAFLVALLGLILPVVPAVVALLLLRRVERDDITTRRYVRGTQVCAVLNIALLVGILAAAAAIS